VKSLAEDLDEVGADRQLRAFVSQRRRAAYVDPNEPALWMIYREHEGGDEEHHPHLESFCVSPGDAIWTAELIAGAPGWDHARREGVGRWLIENLGPEDGRRVLVVRATPDPEQP
jgi:hypothetical protein